MKECIAEENENEVGLSRFSIDKIWRKTSRNSKWRYLVVMILVLGTVFSLQRAQTYQAQAQNPTAILYVGTQQNVGYTFCVDGSDSHSASTDHFTNKDEITTFIWDFGDGTPVEQGEYLNTHTHSYTQYGTYTITLTVVDKNGLTDIATTQVIVTDLPKVTVSGNTTSSISLAISQLNGQPGIVYIPAGDYKRDEEVNIPTGVILEGAGSDKTRIYTTSSTGGMFNIDGNNVRFTGLKMEGFSTDPQTSQKSIAIDVYNGKKNFYIDHSEWLAFASAVNIKWYSSATIEYCYIHHNTKNGAGYGVLVAGEAYAMIRYNELGNCRHVVAGGGCSNEACPTRYDFIYNHVQGHGDVEQKGHVMDMHTPGHGRMRFDYNLFEDVNGVIGLRDGYNVQIKGNTFRNIGHDQGSDAYKNILATHAPYMTGGGDHNSPGVDGIDFFDNTIENAVNPLKIEYGTNIYINCRKMDDQIPFRGNIDWNDCQNTPKTCSELNGDICTSQQICPGNWLPASDTERCCSTSCTSSSQEDINEDGVVNALDVQIVVNAVLGLVSNPRADVNADGVVNTLDLDRLINTILSSP
jgi:PKD repeat protein